MTGVTAQPFEGELISIVRFVRFTLLDGAPIALNVDQIVGVQPSKLGTAIFLTTASRFDVAEAYDTVVDLLNP